MKTVSVVLLASFFLMLNGTVLGCYQDQSKNERIRDSQKTGQSVKEIREAVAPGEKAKNKDLEEKELATVTLGAGCFWCVEAVFEELKGVESVESGYMGGTIPNPTYQQVCTGQTWHAEVCKITYDPEVLSFPELLEVFWKTHDPTTLNAQGPDYGTQYRSAIFYSTEEQKELAEEIKADLNESMAFNAPVVTEITAASEFYPAEDYHQEYFKNNGKQPYCKSVIVPKMKKFRKVFADKLKSSEEDQKESADGKNSSDK